MQRLREGFEADFGCAIHPDKTQANFTITQLGGEGEADGAAAGAGAGPGATADGGPAEAGAAGGSAAAGVEGTSAQQQQGQEGAGVVGAQRDQGGGAGGARGAGGSSGAPLQGTNLWRSADGRQWVRWCGLLLCARSLEVMADYSRYAGCHVRTTMSVPLEARPGEMGSVWGMRGSWEGSFGSIGSCPPSGSFSRVLDRFLKQLFLYAGAAGSRSGGGRMP